MSVVPTAAVDRSDATGLKLPPISVAQPAAVAGREDETRRKTFELSDKEAERKRSVTERTVRLSRALSKEGSAIFGDTRTVSFTWDNRSRSTNLHSFELNCGPHSVETLKELASPTAEPSSPVRVPPAEPSSPIRVPPAVVQESEESEDRDEAVKHGKGGKDGDQAQFEALLRDASAQGEGEFDLERAADRLLRLQAYAQVRGVHEEEWSLNHVKVLYMLSRYAVCAQSAEQDEQWLRHIPLFVLLFEGTVAGVLDFDYGPQSTLISHEGQPRRVWLNISQEGKSAVDDLREARLVNSLKISTNDFQSMSVFQVSLKGLALVEAIPADVKAEMDDFLHIGPDKGLMQVSFDGDSFWLSTPRSGRVRTSGIGKIEEVSYVSSPFLPHCLRANSKPLSSNVAKVSDSRLGNHNIDDVLDEIMALENCSALIGEWIPFGENLIVALNERLGALDRCQGGYFTSKTDGHPTDTKFIVPPGLTVVEILDYDFVSFLNFEAEVNYPSSEGILQIESFGLHVNVTGNVFIGLSVDAVVNSQADNVSLDHLCRLLAGVQKDSSQIMSDLLTPYQHNILDCLFMGDMMNRGKVNLIFADKIKPSGGKQPQFDYSDPHSFTDRGPNENELRQVLGDVVSAQAFGENTLICGKGGFLYAGPSCKRHEKLLVFRVALQARENFLSLYFKRIVIIDDSINQVRKLNANSLEDPSNMDKSRVLLNQVSRDIILLREVLDYLTESVEKLGAQVPPEPSDELGKELCDALRNQALLDILKERCNDMCKLITGAESKVSILRQMTNSANRTTLRRTVTAIDGNYAYLVTASGADARAATASHIMNLIFSGGLAFNLIDRITGDSILGQKGAGINRLPDSLRGTGWVDEYFRDTIIEVPLLWFVLNLLWLAGLLYALHLYVRHLLDATRGARYVRAIVNRRIDVDALTALIATQDVVAADSVTSGARSLVKVQWATVPAVDSQPWGGVLPRITVQYDKETAFLLDLRIEWLSSSSSSPSSSSSSTELTEEGAVRCLHEQFFRAGVYGDPWFLSPDEAVPEASVSVAPSAAFSPDKGPSPSPEPSTASASAVAVDVLARKL